MVEEESGMAVFTRLEATSRYRQEATVKASIEPTQFAVVFSMPPPSSSPTALSRGRRGCLDSTSKCSAPQSRRVPAWESSTVI